MAIANPEIEICGKKIDMYEINKIETVEVKSYLRSGSLNDDE